LAVGICFLKSEFGKTKSIIAGVIYSLDVPVGGIIGLLMHQQTGIVKAILLSISAGTFIYQGATEIIGEEFSTEKNRHIKFLFYLIGFTFMIFVFFIEKWLGDGD
jgi:zinc transporter 1/2/3